MQQLFFSSLFFKWLNEIKLTVADNYAMSKAAGFMIGKNDCLMVIKTPRALNEVVAAQECNATEDERCNAAGSVIIFLLSFTFRNSSQVSFTFSFYF
jgi:hypothetical protein